MLQGAAVGKGEADLGRLHLRSCQPWVCTARQPSSSPSSPGLPGWPEAWGADLDRQA